MNRYLVQFFHIYKCFIFVLRKTNVGKEFEGFIIFL